jgi:hypothetical protein
VIVIVVVVVAVGLVIGATAICRYTQTNPERGYSLHTEEKGNRMESEIQAKGKNERIFSTPNNI